MPYDIEAAKKVAEFAKRQTTVDKGVPVVISKFENKWEIYLPKDRSTATLDNVQNRAGRDGFDKGKARVCTLYKNFLLCHEGTLSKAHLKVVNKSYIKDVYSKPLKAVNAKGEEVDLPDEVPDELDFGKGEEINVVKEDTTPLTPQEGAKLEPDAKELRTEALKKLLAGLKTQLEALMKDSAKKASAQKIAQTYASAVTALQKGDLETATADAGRAKKAVEELLAADMKSGAGGKILTEAKKILEAAKALDDKELLGLLAADYKKLADFTGSDKFEIEKALLAVKAMKGRLVKARDSAGLQFTGAVDAQALLKTWAASRNAASDKISQVDSAIRSFGHELLDNIADTGLQKLAHGNADSIGTALMDLANTAPGPELASACKKVTTEIDKYITFMDQSKGLALLETCPAKKVAIKKDLRDTLDKIKSAVAA
ncbi:MAG: hypothetical protein AAF317_13160 [Pseudomonadota bacterium]